jgi:hypothetical protein
MVGFEMLPRAFVVMGLLKHPTAFFSHELPIRDVPQVWSPVPAHVREQVLRPAHLVLHGAVQLRESRPEPGKENQQQEKEEMTKTHHILQGSLIACSVVSSFLHSKTNFRHKRIAFWISLFVQPVWFVNAYLAAQWGVCFLAVWYAGINVRSLWTHRANGN